RLDRAEAEEAVDPEFPWEASWRDGRGGVAEELGSGDEAAVGDGCLEIFPDAEEGFGERGEFAVFGEALGRAGGVFEAGDGFEDDIGHARRFGYLGEFGEA